MGHYVGKGGVPSAGTGFRTALAEAEAAGILPITSVCNIACLFCSNRANPPGLRVHALAHRPLDDIAEALAGMSRRSEVVIGESVSRVSEGEPLTHPDFATIVRLVRRSCPDAEIRLTTNGTLLDVEMVSLLADLGSVTVTLSLNTTSAEAYQRLHGLACEPRRAPRLLSEAGLPFEASIVAVPAVTGQGDLAATAAYLADQGATHCRVFVPGFTRFTPEAVRAVLPGPEEVARLVEEARAGSRMPLSLEPPSVTGLEAVVSGVLAGTPADRAGVLAGDVVLEVEGVRPLTRVDAFRRCQEALRRRGRCRLRLGGKVARVVELGVAPEGGLRAAHGPQASVRSGLVMDRDFDPDDARTIRELAAGFGASRAVVFTGRLAQRAMELGLENEAAFAVVGVPSGTFGGSIGAAGLLTVADVASALGADHRLVRPGDVVFLPPLAFDRSGLDLTGGSPADLLPLLPHGARLVVPGLAAL